MSNAVKVTAPLIWAAMEFKIGLRESIVIFFAPALVAWALLSQAITHVAKVATEVIRDRLTPLR